MVIKRKDGSVFKLQGTPDEEEKCVVHNFPSSLDDVEIEEIEVQVKKIPMPKLEKPPKKPEPVITTEPVYCLPAEIKETHDPLYDETRSYLVYGKKVVLEVQVVNSGDLQTSFRCPSKASRGSVVYRPSDRRWWKVTDIVQQGDLFTMTCIPSDVHPSFEGI